MAERRSVPGWGGYFVSDDGHVFSHVVRGPGRRIDAACERELHQVWRGGYLAVCMSGHGRQTTKSVHVLVALAFIGPRPVGAHVRHLDGDRMNNRLANLAYGSPRENEADKDRHGRTARGASHGAAKLTENQVAAIKSLLASGIDATFIAKAVDVSRNTIVSIKKGATWAHVAKSV